MTEGNRVAIDKVTRYVRGGWFILPLFILPLFPLPWSGCLLEMDTSGLGSATSSSTSSTSTSASTGSSGGGGSTCEAAVLYDFENCPDGFAASGVNAMAAAPSWACGDPTTGPGTAVTGVWATSLDGDYSSNESSALDSPPISLVGCEGRSVMIDVTHWYETESDWDGGNFSISIDGGTNWTVVDPSEHRYNQDSLNTEYIPPNTQPGFNGLDGIWHTSRIDLSPYLEQPDVRLRLVFGSDDSVEAPGWYIDTIAVTVP